MLSMTVEVGSPLHHEVTPYQQIEIYDSPVFGRMLLLDGHIQLTTLDEWAYHEALVRIPALNLDGARRALIVGGGDGGALRELCRFSALETIEMVEIDEAVIHACRRHLPELSNGAFDDPRVRLHVADAFGFVKTRAADYDLIVLDSTDTYEGEEGEISASLFTRGFYEDCRRALRPGGVVVTQADNPVFCPYSREAIVKQFGDVFHRVGAYWALVPSFGGYSAFCWAGDRACLQLAWDPRWQAGKYLSPNTYALAFEPLPF